MRKKEKQYKAVFITSIDLIRDKYHEESLKPGGVYNFDRYSDYKTSYNDIAKEVCHTINNSLKTELQKYTTISIKEVEVQAEYEGSIEIIFTVVLGFLDLIGGLKDLYDTVELIREISTKYIKQKLSDRFGNHFTVRTYKIASDYNEYYQPENYITRTQRGNSTSERDVFFYYLLIANVILLLILGALVFGAVNIVYFA